jgi:hypothetical protein
MAVNMDEDEDEADLEAQVPAEAAAAAPAVVHVSVMSRLLSGGETTVRFPPPLIPLYGNDIRMFRIRGCM